MPDHDVDVCDDWNGAQGNKVTFDNDTTGPVTITQDGTNIWPFKDGPPLPATGSLPAGEQLVTHLKHSLADGPYTYVVNGCSNQIPKTVTVP